VAYGSDMGNRFTYLGAVFHKAYHGTGLAAQATTMFVNYLFHVYPFDKVYMEVPGFNWPQLRSGEGRFFTLEGRLRDHERYGGQTWDRYICAIYPDGARASDDT
jgi:RimJ/RimL family protein N-acetyltransferase